MISAAGVRRQAERGDRSAAWTAFLPSAF